MATATADPITNHPASLTNAPDLYPHPGPFPVPSDRDFTGPGQRAPELAAIGHDLIADYEAFQHLKEATIAYYWRRKGGSARGRPNPGGVTPAGWMHQVDTDAEFCVWLAADHTRSNGLDTPAVTALIRHQLLHLRPGPEDGQIIIASHDYEAFAAELDIEAPTPPWLRRMVWGAQQLPLLMEEPTDDAPAPVGGDDEAGGDDFQ